MFVGSQSFVTVAITSGAFLGANPKRVAIYISAPTTNRITLTTSGTAIDNQGVVIRPGTLPAAILEQYVGDWVTKAINAITVTAPETIGVIEVLTP